MSTLFHVWRYYVTNNDNQVSALFNVFRAQARSFPSPVLSNAVFNSVEDLLRKLVSEIEQAGFGSAPELQDELEAARAYLGGGGGNRSFNL